MTAIGVDVSEMDSLNVVVVVVEKKMMIVAEFELDYVVAKVVAAEDNEYAVVVLFDMMIGSNNQHMLMVVHNEMALDNLRVSVNNSDRVLNDVRRHYDVLNVVALLLHNIAHIRMNFDAKNRVVQVNVIHVVFCYYYCEDIRNKVHYNDDLVRVNNSVQVIDLIQLIAELISYNIY